MSTSSKLVRICINLALILLSTTNLIKLAAAQPGPPPGGGGYGYPTTVDSISGFSPFVPGQYEDGGNPIKVVGGTSFPWYGRTGNMVTISGTIAISGVPSIDVTNVTVQLNGYNCELTPNPYDFTHRTASWRYMNRDNPITLGNGPSVQTVTLITLYNGVPMNSTQGGLPARLKYKFWVFNVLPFTGSNTRDDVNVSQCYFPGGDTVYASQMRSRDINNQFIVQAPPEANGNFSKITVGIIQTMTEDSTFGFVKGHFNGNNPATFYDHNTLGLPLWDGDGTKPCFASAQSVASCGYPSAIPYVGPELQINDTPNGPFRTTIKSGGASYPFIWGITSGSTTSMVGTFFDVYFEDMLSASSSDCPGVVIPIYGYKVWEATIAGSYTNFNGTIIWSGGGVSLIATNTSNSPVSDPAHGSANSGAAFTYSID